MNENAPSASGPRRRDFLASLATLPALGLFGAALLHQRAADHRRRRLIESDLTLEQMAAADDDYLQDLQGETLRLGLIGAGSRGMDILESLGFAGGQTRHPGYGDLCIRLAGVCDVYDRAAEQAIALSSSNRYDRSVSALPLARRFRHYQDLLDDKEIDAVIIATPDHWHAPMIIKAAASGKHIYAEKCLTRTLSEVYRIEEALHRSPVVFQYGHQNRQQLSYQVARQMVRHNLLGKITLLKTHTYRNTPQGAFNRHIGKDIDPGEVDWHHWLGDTPHQPFSASRYFGWQKFFEYSGGLPAHMFSHEFDAINQVFDLGIPAAVSAMGGIFYWKDDRNTPDVFQAIFEYPERELLLTYDADLANTSTGEYERGAKVKEIIGSDAWMKLGLEITVYPDRNSQKYQSRIAAGVVEPDAPLFSFIPGENNNAVQAVTSASRNLYAGSGLVTTYRNGREVDVTYLHLREWLQAIRTGSKVSGTFDTAFQDAVTCHMATLSYQEKRRVAWDAVRRRVV